MRRSPFRVAATVTVVVVAGVLSGCGVSVPSDPDGTLETVSGGELRVGTSVDPPLVQDRVGAPSGSIVDLVDDFASSLGVEAEWTVATEETLVGMMEDGDLDLIAGGITSDTPWMERTGVTRGYTGIEGAQGREIVMLVPLGENAFLSTLERFLDKEVGT